MTSLLENGSDVARDCLSSQVGLLATRNSCQGPWISNASMSISFNPVKVRMPQRATLSFQLSNPLGAADLLAHGSGNLRGWGQAAFPDQSLLYVRGFDAANQRYRILLHIVGIDGKRRLAPSTKIPAIREPACCAADGFRELEDESVARCGMRSFRD